MTEHTENSPHQLPVNPRAAPVAPNPSSSPGPLFSSG